MEIKKEKSSELISYISHEIKNSLNPVINLSGIMLKEKQRQLSTDERDYLEVIGRNGRKILALVDYLSYINRSKSGKISLSFVSASIKTVIENSVNALTAYKNPFNVKPYCIIENGDSEITVESESFKKIISCITEFFISVNNTDSLYFRISSDMNSLTINISEIDPGEGGLSSEKITGSFDLTSLAETSLLWYSLADELISVTGGGSDIRQLSDGRVVWFVTLPVSQNAASSAVRDMPELNTDLREFILMIIDDDPDTLIPVKAIAEHEFKGLCKVVHACSGSEGIDLLDKIKPDIILLDLTLPDIHGLSLVRNIRNFFAGDDVRIIAFTGHDLGFNREKLISSGFDDIIIKPFHIDEFIEKISSWIK